MKIELTIKVDYLPGWGFFEGVRELLQNAKDAETEFSAPMSVRVRGGKGDEPGVLVIENEGCKLSYEALLLGHTTKAGRAELIGHYGEGFNILYVNNTGSNLDPYHAEIASALKATGELPEELADLFTVRVACANPDGSPRYVIEPA